MIIINNLSYADMIGAGLFILVICILAAVADALFSKGERGTHVESYDGIVGDGAWPSTPAKYPDSALIRRLPEPTEM